MPDPDSQREEAEATRRLTLLHGQADTLREELTRLRGQLAEARRDVSDLHNAELLEANQQLVLAALHANTFAETAAHRLGELTRSSQRDPLTDTPNRELMLDRIQNAIIMAKRHATRLAVLFVDLDHFKQLNDTLGHAAGDAVLQLVATRMASVLRDSDTVSRHSGDEFLVLLAEISQPSDAAELAEKMLAALAAPSRFADQLLSLSASIGIAICPDDASDAQVLIDLADHAMYRCKKSGRGCFAFHTDEAGDEQDEASSSRTASQFLAPAAPQAADDSALLDLREANEKLLVAMLGAHEMQEQSDATHRQQIAFLGMVAHELRNPLAPIRSATELLSHASRDDPMLERLQAIIKRQVDHMTRLVEDLLDGSRVNTGKFRLHRHTIDLRDTLGVALETTRPEMDRRRQQFAIRLPADPVFVDGDAVRLAQVFSNLLDNASKYTQEDGEIAVSARASAHAVEITVADNGIGITAESLPNIFDLFVQDIGSMSHDNGGLGIGLAVVRDLVEAHQGTVVGRSEGLGHGSEFVVTLPLVERQTGPAAIRAP